MLILPRGSYKPPLGAEINWAHPFARKLLFAVPFLGVSRYTFPGTSANDLIVPIWGSVARRTVELHSLVANPYSSNRDGVCVQAAVETTIKMGADPIPASRVTVCLVRRKLDTTHRTGSTFSPASVISGEWCSAFAPFSDGVVYWQFGSTFISVSGLSFSTTIPERWVFVAGPRGMKIWRNGVKVASTSTANPGRTINPARQFHINGYTTGGNGDVQDFNYFAAYDDEWSDELCRWWSAEPYDALYPRVAQRGFVSAGVANRPRARTFVVMR